MLFSTTTTIIFFCLLTEFSRQTQGLLSIFLPDDPASVPLRYRGPKATIDSNYVTVSGFSSGAFMSAQLHFAYSSIIKGSGQFAGGPYAQNYGTGGHGILTDTLAGFFTGATFSTYGVASTTVPKLVARARRFAAAGHIDPLSNLIDSKVFIHHGLIDILVPVIEGERSAKMFEVFGADVKYVLLPNATHTVPTDNFGGPCGILDLARDAVNNCKYEGVFDMFSHIYPDFIWPFSSTEPRADGSIYYMFDQSPFTPSRYTSANPYMASNGFIYIPPGCQDETMTCRLHVALHGCGQSIYTMYNFLENHFATKTGYIQVADANNIVILFPQASPTYLSLKSFNMACWDFFGGTTKNFPYKTSPQMESIMNMVAELTGLPSIP